jgi:hypothetical protein
MQLILCSFFFFLAYFTLVKAYCIHVHHQLDRVNNIFFIDYMKSYRRWYFEKKKNMFGFCFDNNYYGSLSARINVTIFVERIRILITDVMKKTQKNPVKTLN